jgi:nucleoside-diphosphate-sugar epimerase
VIGTARLRFFAVRILVTGGAGMVGRKLVERLARDGVLGGEPISHLALADLVEPVAPAEAGFDVVRVTGDLAEPGVAEEVVSARPDVVFHLAAVLSGEAEADPEKGYRVNLDGTRALLDAIRAIRGYRPRLVFASSIAVFGAPFPEVIDDDFCTTPLTSYGTQKAIGELLLSDYTRRGFLDGIAIRLPTICVRPGKPNRAASSFFSDIIREPLNGQEALLPVPDDVRHWHASPRAAVGFLVRAATVEEAVLGNRRCLTMPGVSATVAEQIEALRRIAGEEVVALIRREPDEMVMRIVAGWPRSFDARRARELGFVAEANFEEIIRVYVEDELGGPIPEAGT